MSEITMLLGKRVDYWVELQKRFEKEQPLDCISLIGEIAQLRGKLSFYESRIKVLYEMAKLHSID